MSKHAFTTLIYISCYIYAYQLRCTKQVILMTLRNYHILSPPLQNQPSLAVCNSSGIHAVCGYTVYQSPKNNYASSKSRDMHKYKGIHIKAVKRCFET